MWLAGGQGPPQAWLLYVGPTPTLPRAAGVLAHLPSAAFSSPGVDQAQKDSSGEVPPSRPTVTLASGPACC